MKFGGSRRYSENSFFPFFASRRVPDSSGPVHQIWLLLWAGYAGRLGAGRPASHEPTPKRVW